MAEVTQRPLNVLLVEKDDEQREAVQEMVSDSSDPHVVLESVGYLADALERLSEGGVDLILLDLDLPDSQGAVTFDRTYAFAPDVPIVVLTDLDDEQVAINTVQGGAQDYLLKDEVEPDLLLRSIRYSVERHRLLSALRSLSLIDDLTGLYNRRGFDDLASQQLKLAGRMARRVVVFYLDIDRIKTINDTLGHHVGDRALLRTAEILKATFRRSDILARTGGDEFAVLAMEASGDDARQIIDRLRSRIEEFNRTSREPYQLSVSLGAARFDPEDPVSLDELVSRAEAQVSAEKEDKRPVISPRPR